MSQAKLRHTLYKVLFIPESDVATIRSRAIDVINSDSADYVTNAYLEAVLSYLDANHLLNLSNLDADAGPRLAHVAEFKRRR